MGEAYPKKSAIPVNTILLVTFVLGFVISISCFNLGIVSKKDLILVKASCGKLSIKSFNSCFDVSLAGYILSSSKIWSIQSINISNTLSISKLSTPLPIS